MGAAVSVDEGSMFTDLKDFYEIDILPKLKSGEMTEADAYQEMKLFYELNKAETKDSKSVDYYPSAKDLPKPPRSFTQADAESKIEDISSEIMIGDVVKVLDKSMGLYFEGVVVSKLAGNYVGVDLGDEVLEVYIPECSLVIKSGDLEVGDQVEMKDEYTALKFLGTLISFNEDGTVNIELHSDAHSPVEEENRDIEYNVDISRVRKLMTGRSLAIEKFKRIVRKVEVANEFIRAGRKFHHDRPEEK